MLSPHQNPHIAHVSGDKPCLVVGCGFSGGAVARLLAEEAGKRVLLIDRRDHPGGNAADYKDAHGITVHRYGSHIFHTALPEVWNFVTRFSAFNTYRHSVVAMVDGQEVPVPFNLHSLHLCFPAPLAERLERKLLDHFDYGTQVPVLSFMHQQDADLRFLAEYVYEKIFYGYTTKQWGFAPEKLDEVVTARVPVRISRDTRYFADPYQGIPLKGYSELVRRMVDHPNIELALGTDFADIQAEAGKFPHIFYTGSIDEYFGYTLGELSYRSVRFAPEEHDIPYYQSHAVVNYPCDHDFTRIHEYKYYLGEQTPHTVIAKEYPEPFVRGRNERFYPITNAETARLYTAYAQLAAKDAPHVHFLGRLGDYHYYNMDTAIARAFQLFRSLRNEL